jgi:predicted transcriptional regulator
MDKISGKIIIHDKIKICTREFREIVKPQQKEKKRYVKKLFSVMTYNSLRRKSV